MFVRQSQQARHALARSASSAMVQRFTSCSRSVVGSEPSHGVADAAIDLNL